MNHQPIDLNLEFLKLLAHDLRWDLLAELAQSDRRVGELVTLTSRPQNLISYHLAQLRDGGLVREQRSSADGRDVYYHLDLPRLEALYRQSGTALHPALAGMAGDVALPLAGNRPRVLFLCTHNSARSQMAEAFLRAAMGEQAIVASAGSEPGSVHPLAIRVMAERGIDLSDRRSKHVDEVAARPWDRVITVCDRIREVCPVFPRETVLAHWSVRDPAAATGTDAERLAAFRATADEMNRRVTYLKHDLLTVG
jgi:thioredoxin type arsenate reductase